MEEKDFENVLDQDEQILKIIRPNKKRYVLLNLLCSSLLFFIIGVGLIIGSVFALKTNKEHPWEAFGILLAFGLLFIILMIYNTTATIVTYKKTAYALTNKKIIIKSGFSGSEFKTMNLAKITSISVTSDLLDKAIKPTNTGSIELYGTFGTNVTEENSKRSNCEFILKSIDEPYEFYKLLNQYVEVPEAKKD